MLAGALGKAVEEAAGAGLEPSAAAAAAEAVEAALLEVHHGTTKEYAERARALTFNLKVRAAPLLCRSHVCRRLQLPRLHVSGWSSAARCVLNVCRHHARLLVVLVVLP